MCANPQGFCRAQRPVPAVGPHSSLSRQTLRPLRRGSRWHPASGGSEVADSSAGRAATAGPLAPWKGRGRTGQPAAGGLGSSLRATPHPRLHFHPARRGHGSWSGLGMHSHQPRWALPRPVPAAELGPRPDIRTSFDLSGESHDQSAGSSEGKTGSGKEAPGSTPAPAVPTPRTATSVPEMRLDWGPSRSLLS